MMIKYRKSSRVRDMIGAAVLAFAATLLWVGSSQARDVPGEAVYSVEAQASIRALDETGLDRI